MNFLISRYVEKNATQANFVKRAEDWSFGSLWIHQQWSDDEQVLLLPWPRPRQYKKLEGVNEPKTEAELTVLKLQHHSQHAVLKPQMGHANRQKTRLGIQPP